MLIRNFTAITKSYPINGNREKKPYLRQLGAASIGIEMGVSVVIGYLIGSWLDAKGDTKPWFTLGFILLGVAAGFISLFKHARRTLKDLEAASEENEENPTTQAQGPHDE